MRSSASLVSLLLVLAIAFGIYYVYFKGSTDSSQAVMHPAETISLTGVKNDLIAIAQAERIYNAQNGSYGSLEQLTSSGSLSTAQTGRDGYTYSIETSASGFTVTARCPVAPGALEYPTLSIDQTMEIHQSN
jgi:hypothetical protein